MKTQTLNIALPVDLVSKVDDLAKKEYRNRSELIRESLRIYINEREEWGQIFKSGEKTMKEMGITNEEEIDKTVYEFRHKRK